MVHGSIADSVEHALRSPRSLTPLVLLMGFLGATLRYALEAALPAGDGFPVATLSVNIFGCFTLEIINQYVARRTKLPAPLVKSMGVGLIGGFSTLSTMNCEAVDLTGEGRRGMAAAYVAATYALTLGAAGAGFAGVSALL